MFSSGDNLEFKKKAQSTVSMVMPVYNKIKYIDVMLESVYKQNWNNIELIMVNDGATDGTRERLSVWKPLFESRGYKIVIIDQKNQGVPGAVKSGLQRITGDYTCLVDCDDKLDPEYVFIMASWLDEHPEDMWVACTFNRVVMDGYECNILSTIDASEIPTPPLMMEMYLSGKYVTEVWIYMVRTGYLRECRGIDRFVTDIRSTQEPGFLLPLIIGCGRLKVINRPLYNHNVYPERTSGYHSSSYKIDFMDKYRDIVVKVIYTLDADKTLKNKWKIMAELAHKHFVLLPLIHSNASTDLISKYAQEAASLIKTHFKPDPDITAKHILENGYLLLSTAITDCILGRKSQGFPKFTERIIGCGALGKTGRCLIPKIVGTKLEPTELWDYSATPGNSVCGIPVSIPNFDSLMPKDVILIFPIDQAIESELYMSASEHGIEKIFLSSEINNLMAELNYPQFYHKCEFFE